MPSIAYDMGFLKAGVNEIESYLLSKNLFWPLSSAPPIGEPGYPRLTLGGLLLSVARIRSRNLHPPQAITLHSLEKKLDHWRTGWRTTWERKGQREFKSRLRQWKHYLNELHLNPDVHIPYYDSEVRIRVLIDLLKPEIGSLEDQYIEQLIDLDGFLKSILDPGVFIWEDALSTGFDRDIFWFLWGIPKLEEMRT